MDQSKAHLGVTFGSLAVLGPRAVMDIARIARDMGYQSLWTVEATGTDAFTSLGSVSAVAPELDLWPPGLFPYNSVRRHWLPCQLPRCRRLVQTSISGWE